MVCDPNDKIQLLQRLCKHDVGFRFLRCEAADRLPGVWTCPLGCGYTMNFSPDHYPYGVAYRDEPIVGKIITLEGSKGVPP